MGQAEEILERFDRSHWSDLVPVLEVDEQHIVLSYFEARDMKSRFNSHALRDNRNATIGSLIDIDFARHIARYTDGVLGPYFLDEEYSPRGVGFWIPESHFRSDSST